MVILGGTFWSLKTSYAGQVVAKLPFEPFTYFAKLTHAGLPGNDLTDCSFHGVVSVCLECMYFIVVIVCYYATQRTLTFGRVPVTNMTSHLLYGLWTAMQNVSAFLS